MNTVDIRVLRSIVAPLLEQGTTFVAIGCGRVYVARVPSTKCRKCNGVHDNHKITKIGELDDIIS